ncbi:MAG: hypothetical protein WAL90_17595 [Desulfobacterales bacterium]
MVGEYEERFYQPIVRRLEALLEKGGLEARNLAIQEKQLVGSWKDIVIGPPVQSSKGPFRVGEQFDVTVEVSLGELKPEDVDVELYSGHMKSVIALEGVWTAPMSAAEYLGSGRYRYEGQGPCLISGRYGFTVRVRPRGDGAMKNLSGLIAWA